MDFRFLFTAVAASALFSNGASAETLDNSAIINLVNAGIGSAAIIAKIETSDNTFDVTTTAIIALAQAGVNSEVIAAMIAAQDDAEEAATSELSLDSPDPMIPHPPGVYLLIESQDTSRMELINATSSNQTRSGGFLGYALTAGIAPMSFKTSIPNQSARVVTSEVRPTFYFYFDQATASLSDGARNSFWGQSQVTSPAEFSLVEFDVKRDRREARVGSFSIAGARQGVDSEDQIQFDFNMIMPGVFEVRPTIDLEPGEYGFIYSASSGGGVGAAGVGAMTSRIFDFSVVRVGE